MEATPDRLGSSQLRCGETAARPAFACQSVHRRQLYVMKACPFRPTGYYRPPPPPPPPPDEPPPPPPLPPLLLRDESPGGVAAEASTGTRPSSADDYRLQRVGDEALLVGTYRKMRGAAGSHDDR